MTTRQPTGNRTFDMVRQLLDRGYAQAAGTVLRTVQYNSTSGIMERRLAELADEAQALTEAGDRLTPENAILRALLADFDDVMRANRVLVASAAEDVQGSGANVAGISVRQMALPGVSDEALRLAGIMWNRPDPAAVAQLVSYTTSDAWQERLDRYGEGMGTLAQNAAVRGMVQGWGPIRTAQQVQSVVTGLPTAYANAMLRTLQITSYRDAQVAHRVANSHIITEHIRIASLDDRTCMACVALHGTVLRPDERVDDHHSGRCDSVSVVVGRAAPQVESGEDWFARQPEERQRAMMGESAYRLWQDGAIQIRDYPRAYTDPVFGQMVQAASLKGMLGGQGQRYFSGGPTSGGGGQSLAERNRRAMAMARAVTPEALEAGRLTGELADYMYGLIAYDEEANALFDLDRLSDASVDLLYNVHTMGRGNVPMAMLQEVRLQASGLVAADEWIRAQAGFSALNAKDLELLNALASERDNTVLSTIDNIRDRRLKGSIAARTNTSFGTYRGSGFVGAAEADGAARLREARAPMGGWQ